MRAYEDKKFRTIAVDFDGCLHSGQWPEIGKPNNQAITELIRRKANGDKIILWSCREKAMLHVAVMWCMNQGLAFDAINDNLPEYVELYGNNTRKVYADEYWDDKSVPVIAGNTQVKQGPEGWIMVMVDPPKRKNKLVRMINRIFSKEGNDYKHVIYKRHSG